MYRHIIFDFGGVFLKLSRKNLYIKHLSIIFNMPEEDAARIWVMRRGRLLTGKETPRQFLGFLSRKLRIDMDVESASKKWSRYNAFPRAEIDWKLVALMKRLKKHYGIHMFSNAIEFRL